MKAALTDIDIDVRDRSEVLALLKHIPASRLNQDTLMPHPNGVYFHEVPTDPLTGLSSIPFREAEEIGFFKIDFLNVHIYDGVRDETHLLELMHREPIWDLLYDDEFVTSQQIWQLHNRPDVLKLMKPRTIEQLAMTIAIIRPAKLHLIGKPWAEIEKDIWITPSDPQKQKTYFKKSHSLAYALAIVVQLNLIVEQLTAAQATPK